jgi:hypothetical protein
MLPRMYRPSVVIRRKALRSGLLGPSMFWKVVAVAVFGSSTLRKFFGRHVEVLEIAKMKGGGHVMQIETFPYQTRRQRRRSSAGAAR